MNQRKSARRIPTTVDKAQARMLKVIDDLRLRVVDGHIATLLVIRLDDDGYAFDAAGETDTVTVLGLLEYSKDVYLRSDDDEVEPEAQSS